MEQQDKRPLGKCELGGEPRSDQPRQSGQQNADQQRTRGDAKQAKAFQRQAPPLVRLRMPDADGGPNQGAQELQRAPKQQRNGRQTDLATCLQPFANAR